MKIMEQKKKDLLHSDVFGGWRQSIVKQHWRESMFLMVDVGTIVHGKASFIMSMVGEYPQNLTKFVILRIVEIPFDWSCFMLIRYCTKLY